MTTIEAIEKLRAYHKCQRLQVKGIYEDCNEKLCDNCDLCYAQGNTGEHIKSIEIAIKALEKQIPKKIAKYNVCPVCNKNQSETWYCAGSSYCECCGQKLDWSN